MQKKAMNRERQENLYRVSSSILRSPLTTSGRLISLTGLNMRRYSPKAFKTISTPAETRANPSDSSGGLESDDFLDRIQEGLHRME